MPEASSPPTTKTSSSSSRAPAPPKACSHAAVPYAAPPRAALARFGLAGSRAPRPRCLVVAPADSDKPPTTRTCRRCSLFLAPELAPPRVATDELHPRGPPLCPASSSSSRRCPSPRAPAARPGRSLCPAPLFLLLHSFLPVILSHSRSLSQDAPPWESPASCRLLCATTRRRPSPGLQCPDRRHRESPSPATPRLDPAAPSPSVTLACPWPSSYSASVEEEERQPCLRSPAPVDRIPRQGPAPSQPACLASPPTGLGPCSGYVAIVRIRSTTLVRLLHGFGLLPSGISGGLVMRHAKQQQGEGVSEMWPMSLIASVTD